MSFQAIDTGIERTGLEDFLRAMPLWSTPYRQTRNSYVLSPSAFVVTPTQREAFERMGRAVYSALEGLRQELAILAEKRSLSREEARLCALARRGARGLLTPGTNGTWQLPPVVKVDLALDAQAHPHVLEVDAYNPRGFGYIALLDEQIKQLTSFTRARFPGAPMLAELFKKQAVARDSEWLVLISEFESFYKPAFETLASILSRYEVRIALAQESELARGCPYSMGAEYPAHLLAIPESLDKYPKVREMLLDRFCRGQIRTFYEPYAFFGSKAFLPFLPKYAEELQEFTPPTALAGKRDDPFQVVSSDRPTVLKAVLSSGMKGVTFSDIEPETFRDVLNQARRQRLPGWVLQEQVPQAQHPVVVFDEDGKRAVRNYHFRVIAHVTPEGVLDIEVTGRPDRKVHGAPDCIQLPSVLE